MPKGGFGNLIALRPGCLDAAMSLLRENGIACDLRDERFSGQPLAVSFVGSLPLNQESAIAGVLHAPTVFGKTFTAAAMIARRGVNTLVLVHRTELLTQWQERLQAFLGVAKGVVGTIGGGKAKPTRKIDESQGRQFRAVLDEALRDYTDRQQKERPRRRLMAWFASSADEFDNL